MEPTGLYFLLSFLVSLAPLMILIILETKWSMISSVTFPSQLLSLLFICNNFAVIVFSKEMRIDLHSSNLNLV